MTAPSAQRFVPMLHVAQVPRAVAFYATFGFAIGNAHYEPSCGDDPVWVSLQSPGGAELMLVLADGPVDDTVQAVLFYVYCDDVAAMRERVLAAGIDAGAMAYPFYRPKGEFRVRDPDGYVLMVTHHD
ncbi:MULTISPECIES: VOC family protein [Lysobacter]|uniref:VOC family protein n=1 Tax=Lysobacter TaxID=68 RepID=UPI000AB1E44B|nr:MULTISPECIES: VOC family protein [Lysobacter]